MFELTCPAEEGIEAAKIRKQAKYAPLTEAISIAGWKSVLFTVEVGARGFIPTSSHHPFNKLGLCGTQVNALMSRISLISAKCSYAIYLASNSKAWDQQRALVEN